MSAARVSWRVHKKRKLKSHHCALILIYGCLAECDNCAQTLLKDLENLDEELRRIKSQLGNATASASAQERLKELEKALLDTKVTCQGPARLSCKCELFKMKSKGKKNQQLIIRFLYAELNFAHLLARGTAHFHRKTRAQHGCACSNTGDPSLIGNLSEFSSKAHVST